MGNRKIWFYSSLTVLVITAVLLISGSSILIRPLSSDPYIPLGTPITWLGIISLPLSIYLGNKKFRNPSNSKSKFLSDFLKICLFLAILWAPVCYLLAGNFSNTFTEKEEFQGGQLAMQWFWRFTYGIVIAPFLIFIISLIFALFGTSKK